MMDNGWMENEFLPKKWMFKEKTKKSPHLKIVSEEGIKFASLKSVLSFMETNERYSEKDLKRFKLFPTGKLQQTKKEALNRDKKNEENMDQSNEIAKPIKKETGVRQYSYKQYAKILKMESNEEELQECKNFYSEKGWSDDDLLPSLWMFRQKPGFTSFQFLSSKGDLLLSTKEANKYLANLKVDHVIDARKLKEKINEKQEVEMEITAEVKEEYSDDEDQIDVKKNMLDDIKQEESQKIVDDSIEMKDPENVIKIKEETVKLPSGITMKRVCVETKSKNTKQEEMTKAPTSTSPPYTPSAPIPAVDFKSLKFGSNNKLVKKDTAEIVEKFKTVNSGLKISLTSVQN